MSFRIVAVKAALVAALIIGIVIAMLFIWIDMPIYAVIGLLALGSFISFVSGFKLWMIR